MKEDLNKIGPIVLILIIYFGYQLVFVNPQKKIDADMSVRNAIESERKQRMFEQESCLSTARSDYMENWASACKISGINNYGPNCNLPNHSADRLNGFFKDNKDLCIKRYPPLN